MYQAATHAGTWQSQALDPTRVRAQKRELNQPSLASNVHLASSFKNTRVAIQTLSNDNYTPHYKSRVMDPTANLYPRAEDGLRSMAAVFSVAQSGKDDGKWLDARPPSMR
ncbi:hypothetical protein NIG5292_01242 [Nereida ignava]|uniref:Uncharacterized protein n=1 Tax=Nereida ignava TaxID=282199 RepID=A0A0U1NL11_9RHOB|nr:hypothetical protein NIG5292_01242 [Nereida ignava]SFI98474.1 hypothetical protein SAMN02745667_00070 [Nereida ignava DSM 16309]